MVKILENTTASPVIIADLGITVPASGQFLIQQSDYENAACSEDIILPIADGTLTVNDGQIALTPAEGIGLIQGSFIKKDFVDSLKMNDRLKVDIIGSLNLASTDACAYLNQITAQTGIGTTDTVLVLDNTPINTNPAVLDITTNPGEFITLASGNYEFELKVTLDTENARRTSKTTFQKFNTTSMIWEDIPLSIGSPSCYGYHRNNASGENTAYNRIIVTADQNDRFRYAMKSLNAPSIRTVPDGISLVIKQV